MIKCAYDEVDTIVTKKGQQLVQSIIAIVIII